MDKDLRVGNCQLMFGDYLERMKEIPDGSVELVIADPPYWKVVNEKWDYKWRTEERRKEDFVTEICRYGRCKSNLYFPD